MRYLIGICALAILGLQACGDSSSEAKANSKPANGNAPSIKASAVIADVTTTRERIASTGTVLADEEVELQSEISGRIDEIFFEEGELVPKGKLLMRLVNDDLRAEVRKLEYELKLQEDREERQRKLLDIKAVSQEVYDTELNQLNVLRAQQALLEAQLAKTEIRAPFEGYIGLRYVSRGAIVSPGTNIATLQKIKPVKIEFTVPERYGRRVVLGSEVQFTVAGLRDTLHATVYAREPRVDANSRSLRFRARHPNGDGQLLPGSFANVRLNLSEEVEVIELPGKALVPVIKGAMVLVLENGRVAERPVELANRDAEVVRVLSGLQQGDTVLTSGILQARPGSRVEVEIHRVRNGKIISKEEA